jgi:hypothetical protein
MSFWMTWMQFFKFFYYICVFSDGYQKDTRRSSNIPHLNTRTYSVKVVKYSISSLKSYMVSESQVSCDDHGGPFPPVVVHVFGH